MITLEVLKAKFEDFRNPVVLSMPDKDVRRNEFEEFKEKVNATLLELLKSKDGEEIIRKISDRIDD